MKRKNISPLNQKKEDQQLLNLIGKNIRQLRNEKDISQEKLGFNSNLDRTYIGAVERGERNITVLKLKQIADALEVSVVDILSKK